MFVHSALLGKCTFGPFDTHGRQAMDICFVNNIIEINSV